MKDEVSRCGPDICLKRSSVGGQCSVSSLWWTLAHLCDDT